MPVVQHEIDSDRTSTDPFRLNSTEIYQFLTDVQQQAIATNQPKIASLSFSIEAIAPWQVLSTLGSQRHFYYDSPERSIVGIGCAVECATAGFGRFAQAQDFLRFWQDQFVYACSTELRPNELRPNKLRPTLSAACAGHFFCSATFFSEPFLDPRTPTQLASFEPAHLFVPKVQIKTAKMNLSDSSTVTFNCLMTAATNVKRTVADIQTDFGRLIAAARLPQGYATTAAHKQSSYDASYQTGYQTGYQTSRSGLTHFKPAVKAALRQLQTNRLHKVVLADVLDVEGMQAFDGVRSLQTLRQNHPDCTVFSVSNGRGQSFIGASPERLLSITDGRFTTDALAGTVSRGQLPGLDSQLAQTLVNSKKEQFEHRLVVEFIVEQLRSLGLTPEYDPLPKVLQLLHVQHLHTPISADIIPSQSVSPLELLAKLHPTPAVAGVPHQAACELIRQYETFDRGLYAAPLGWIDTEGNSEFIVGIRSALLDGCRARLYAGAGIVAASEPEKELAEIKLKLQALLNALV